MDCPRIHFLIYSCILSCYLITTELLHLKLFIKVIMLLDVNVNDVDVR